MINQNLKFVSFPIEDRQVTASSADFSALVQQLTTLLVHGKNVLIHCRQGVGRTGLVAACPVIASGMEAGEAVQLLSKAREVLVAETPEQLKWISQFARSNMHPTSVL